MAASPSGWFPGLSFLFCLLLKYFPFLKLCSHSGSTELLEGEGLGSLSPEQDS